RRADRGSRFGFRGSSRVTARGPDTSRSCCFVGHARRGSAEAHRTPAAGGRGRKRPGGGDRPVTSYITLSYLDLALASVLVLIDAGLSLIFGLKVHRNLLIAAIRMSVQLTLIGLVLTALFSLVSPLWTGLAILAMILFAGQEVMQRQDRRLSGWWSFGMGTSCMMMSSVLVTAFALLTAIRPSPWYDPRYPLPLLGMILATSITPIA